MATSKRLDCLKFEGRPSINEDVEKVEFVEAVELHFDRNLQFGSGKSSGQLPLVNFLVEESSELVMNVEDTAHHVICDFAKGDLVQTTDRCMYLNRHRVIP